MHCAHFSFALLGPHRGFLDLTECAHVHEFMCVGTFDVVLEDGRWGAAEEQKAGRANPPEEKKTSGLAVAGAVTCAFVFVCDKRPDLFIFY